MQSSLVIALAALFVTLALVRPGDAQTRRPEVFALAGFARVAGDEGYLGSGLAVGGALTLPFARRWALDLDIGRQRAERNFGLSSAYGRHIHVSPAIQYRRGSDRAYGFVGGGAGLSSIEEGGRDATTSVTSTTTGLHSHGKAGFVGALTDRIVVRAEFFGIFRYVLPHVGVKGGVGYRF